MFFINFIPLKFLMMHSGALSASLFFCNWSFDGGIRRFMSFIIIIPLKHYWMHYDAFWTSLFLCIWSFGWGIEEFLWAFFHIQLDASCNYCVINLSSLTKNSIIRSYIKEGSRNWFNFVENWSKWLKWA